MRQLRQKIDAAAIEEILKFCRDQFQDRILPGFKNDGKDWTIEYDMPRGVLGFRTGRLKFSNQEIWNCLRPSICMIVDMLERTIEALHEAFEMISARLTPELRIRSVMTNSLFSISSLLAHIPSRSA